MQLQAVGTVPVVDTLRSALLAAVLAHAVYTDLRTRRISNRVTHPAMVAGLLLNLLGDGWGGLGRGGLGWLVGLGLLLLPFALGGMGAGDVKLLAVVGAFLGPRFVVETAFYGGLAGGVVVVACLARQRRLRRALRGLAMPRTRAGDGRGGGADAIPFAPAIAAGVLLAWLPTPLPW